MKGISVVLILFLLLSCSVQRKLSRHYIGKTIAEVQSELGPPKTVFERSGEKIYVFERTEELRSTEINQAKLALDPMVTPKVTKTERYYISVKNELVTKVELENDYER